MGKTPTQVMDADGNVIGWVMFHDTSDTFPDGFAATRKRMGYETQQGLHMTRRCECGDEPVDGFLYQPYPPSDRYVKAKICPHCRVILPGDWLAPYGCDPDGEDMRNLWISGHPFKKVAGDS